YRSEPFPFLPPGTSAVTICGTAKPCRCGVSQPQIPTGTERLMPGTLIVETERLWLGEFVEEDAEAFLRLVSDPLVTRYTGDGGVVTLEQAREGLRSRPIADYQKHGFGRWACVLKSSGEI